MKKKLLRSCVVSAMVSSLMLTGCASQKSGSGDESNKENVKKEVPKVHFFSNNGTLLNEKPEGSDPQKLQQMTDLIRERAGIEPVAIVPPKGAAGEKLNILLSSNEKIDMFNGAWDSYASKGVLRSLNDLLDKYGSNIKKVFSEEEWKSVTDKEGNIWGIPSSRAFVGYPVYVRADWLKKLNLQMPKTLDELEAVLKAFRDLDPDGNGKADSIPLMTDLTGLRYGMLGGFIEGENGYSTWLDPADKKIKPVELHPGYKDFLTKMADWYQKGYIDKEALTKDDSLALLKTNRVGASVKYFTRVALNQPKLKSSFPEMDFQLAKGITGPKGKLQTSSSLNSAAILITKKAEHPEAAVKFIDWVYQDVGNWLTAVRGVEGEDWNWTDKSKRIFELSKERKYAGEFATVQVADIKNSPTSPSPETAMMYDYFNAEMYQFGNAKRPLDYNIIYDTNSLKENVPNLGDIDRLIKEETVKFIMGARPMSDYEKFIEQLYKVGMDKLIDEKTAQYNSRQKK
ncbi:extracellular solute-binding protein [Paenibacillus contaminans]|uniref:ABC transporter substrate-binding protein n=1 Tax=Paenibacillus contaminans TaxID=450362 RepID=A0A329MNL5_9BACL|nr:extracellular solute-binding protein [Paenibacillus contaminans]RAV21541.1 ABC transporter substrate-binding protein [Paenibacillus contaminans]